MVVDVQVIKSPRTKPSRKSPAKSRSRSPSVSRSRSLSG
ncbi:hypothetical protein V6N11_006761 [Hibiscus sabdariffa]|uniref:Uncharacterized protein n=1 Tax=Hibiscus sabdariffa TaxID=183260 RepID=A0ABR2RS30_9ROSI